MTVKDTNSQALNYQLPLEVEDERKINVGFQAAMLLIVAALGLFSNWIATGTNPLVALPGMAILYVVSVAGLTLARFVPFYLPSVAWISLLAILITIPGFPGAQLITSEVDALNFLALATPALAYGGLALTQNEFSIARHSGWKIVIVAILVMFGTYIGSVIVADLTLKISG